MPFVKIVQNPMIHCSLALFAVVSGPNASILTLPRPENRVESRGVHAKNQCDSGTHIVAYDSSLCLEIEQLGLVSDSKRIILCLLSAIPLLSAVKPNSLISRPIHLCQEHSS